MKHEYISNSIRALVLSFKITIIILFAYTIYLGMNWAVKRSVSQYEALYAQPAAISLKERERQLTCLSQNIYWEAANEPFEGKVAVAQVTLNRAAHSKFPNDICKVVYQKNIIYDKVVCQFSWYCESNHKVRPVHKRLYEEAEAVAKKVLLEGFRLDSVREAIYYHADYVNPKWGKEKIAVIGRHIFYKE